MHKIQRAILKNASEQNLGNLTLREIGALVDVDHPQKIKHHLGQLEKKGLIIINKEKRIIERVHQSESPTGKIFRNIPIFGSANCGPASLTADENLEGYLKVSKSFLEQRKDLFAVKVVGDSMNQANIKGNNIEEGDYVIVWKKDADTNYLNRKYVLSIIDGSANIKKFLRDEKNKRILLVSESTKKYPPIIIHKEDYKDFLVNGIVIDVIKKL